MADMRDAMRDGRRMFRDMNRDLGLLELPVSGSVRVDLRRSTAPARDGRADRARALAIIAGGIVVYAIGVSVVWGLT